MAQLRYICMEKLKNALKLPKYQKIEVCKKLGRITR